MTEENQENKVDFATQERDKYEGTHDARFAPPMLTLVRDEEWDNTHITWEGPDGVRYRVHHDDWRYVCPKTDVPPQPSPGWAVVFEDRTQWFRTGDGLWYLCNALEGSTGLEWDALWQKRGTVHAVTLAPVADGCYPFMMPSEGPEGSIVLPEKDEDGNPDLGAGHVAVIDENRRLVIRHLKSNSEIKLSSDDAFNIFAMFVRTFYNEKVAQLAGPKAQDTGSEVIIVPED